MSERPLEQIRVYLLDLVGVWILKLGRSKACPARSETLLNPQAGSELRLVYLELAWWPVVGHPLLWSNWGLPKLDPIVSLPYLGTPYAYRGR